MEVASDCWQTPYWINVGFVFICLAGYVFFSVVWEQKINDLLLSDYKKIKKAQLTYTQKVQPHMTLSVVCKL